MLEVSGLSGGYGRIEALHGVAVTIRRGEIVALIGANGAGKTTLLRTISGVQPLVTGTIHFEGEEITRAPAHARVRAGIIQVPEGRQVFRPMSVEDNLRLGAYARSVDSERTLAHVYELFPVLKEKRRLAAGGLSGGQQQMLAIGRALMGAPKLLLLDEPSMGLAPILVAQIFDVIGALKKEGITIFLVEQNASAALAIADHAYVLETGRIAFHGTGSEIAGNDAVRRAYLGI
jgi:branched-chain amino acid transport system ATP-binding protein